MNADDGSESRWQDPAGNYPVTPPLEPATAGPPDATGETAWPRPGGAGAVDPPPEPSPDPQLRSFSFRGVAAGLLVGVGILLAGIGLFSAYKVWNGVETVYGGMASNPAVINTGGSSDPYRDVVDLQRWTSVNGALVVVALGLLLVAAGFIVNRMDRSR